MSIPLGANRVWAWSLLEISIFALSITVVARELIAPSDDVVLLKKTWVVAACFLWVVFWLVIQGTVRSDGSSISEDVFLTRIELLKSLAYSCMFALSIYFLSSRERVTRTIYVIVFAGLAQAFLGAWWVIEGTQSRASGTFISYNHFSGFLEMSIALGVGMMIALPSSRGSHFRSVVRSYAELLLGPKARLRIVLVIMVVGLVMSGSRMGNSAFFGSILISGTLTLLLAKKLNRSTVVLLVSLIVIDIALIGTYFGVERVVNRIQETTMSEEQRVELNRYTVNIVRDHTLTGTGAGTFRHVFPQYRGADVIYFFTNAENDYLEFLSEYGIIGFIPLALIVILSYGAALKTIRTRRSPFYRGIAFGSLMAMTSILIHSFADFNLHIPANACLFMVVLALAWASLNVERARNN